MFLDDRGGEYGYGITNAVQGEKGVRDSINLGPASQYKPGSSPLVASYHSHGDYSLQNGEATTEAKDEYHSNKFSDRDKLQAIDNNRYSYLSTPSKEFFVFKPSDNLNSNGTQIN